METITTIRLTYSSFIQAVIECSTLTEYHSKEKSLVIGECSDQILMKLDGLNNAFLPFFRDQLEYFSKIHVSLYDIESSSKSNILNFKNVLFFESFDYTEGKFKWQMNFEDFNIKYNILRSVTHVRALSEEKDIYGRF